jgi:hypothetical protein
VGTLFDGAFRVGSIPDAIERATVLAADKDAARRPRKRWR